VLRRFFKGTGSVLRFIKQRLSERSTWAGISAGISGAAMLPYPWSAVVAVIGAAMAIMPESTGKVRVEGE